MNLSVNENFRDSLVASHCHRAKFEMPGTWSVSGETSDPWLDLQLKRLSKTGESVTWTLSDANNSFERADGTLEGYSVGGKGVSVTIRLTGAVKSDGVLKED